MLKQSIENLGNRTIQGVWRIGFAARFFVAVLLHSGTAFRRFGFVQSSVVTRWPEIVGEAHARVCAPEAIRFPPGEKSEGILELVVTPAHAPLIQHVIPEIMERVNRFFGYRAVARVKLRQGAVKPPQDRECAKAPPSLKPIPMELGAGLRDIGDAELRAVLEQAQRALRDMRGSAAARAFAERYLGREPG